MTLDLDRAVLLPIDMQQAFDGPSWPPRWNSQADANGLALLEAWRSAGRAIIHVRHDSIEPGSTLAPGTPGNALRPGFEPLDGEPLVTKSVNSAFIGTDLDLRLILGGGVGYQWFETPTFNLNTEAGPAWIYEKFTHQPSEDHVALRLAYHVDWTPHKALKLFHNFEYLPRVTEPFVDYNMNLDAGLRATVIQNFFAEFKFEFKYDSTPAIGARKEDLRYLVGLGWAF